MIDQPLGTVVIGGSQAGLAVGYFLKKRHRRLQQPESSVIRTGAE
jgi:protoporphyrinogen oxidase